MNILILNAQGINPIVGGIERVSWLLSEQWKKNNKVYFLSCFPPNKVSELKVSNQFYLPNFNYVDSDENIVYFINFVKTNNIDIIVNQSINVPRFHELCYRVKTNTGAKLISVLHFAPDHHYKCVMNSFFAPIILNNTRIIFKIKELFRQAYHKYYNMPLHRRNQYGIYKHIYDDGDAFVLLSKHFSNKFIQGCKIHSTDKLFAINNPIPILDEKCFICKEKMILFVGRLDFHQKRLDRLIDIWSNISNKYTDWHLVILGDGFVRRRYEEYSKKKDIKRIHFEGTKNSTEYYQKASILCMTSSSEGWGMVLVEAQQHGCIPIAYDSFEAINDIINDGINGYKVTAFNKKEYISKLSTLIENEEIRTKMSQNARNSVLRFNSLHISKEWESLFNMIIK